MLGSGGPGRGQRGRGDRGRPRCGRESAAALNLQPPERRRPAEQPMDARAAAGPPVAGRPPGRLPVAGGKPAMSRYAVLQYTPSPLLCGAKALRSLHRFSFPRASTSFSVFSRAYFSLASLEIFQRSEGLARVAGRAPAFARGTLLARFDGVRHLVWLVVPLVREES